MTRLVVTNGDAAADLLSAAGCDGTILPWRDVLHEGPVVPGGLAACSRVRVPWLTRRFAIGDERIEADFTKRDAVMENHTDFDEIELWFEHDLFDQLQLLQVLDHFARVGRTDGLNLVQTDEFLGHQTPETVLRFRSHARPAATTDLDTARTLWRGLADGTPANVAEALASRAPFSLPFVESALRRFLRELPSAENGLSLTQQGILDDLAEAPATGAALFRASIAREEAEFMGDWSFLLVIDDLATGPKPLLLAEPGDDPANEDAPYRRLVSSTFVLTDAGRAVRAGEADHVSVNGADRWWAGTRLLGRQVWRVDDAGRPVPPPVAAEA